jgi:L-fuculose-phosphate aldolase
LTGALPPDWRLLQLRDATLTSHIAGASCAVTIAAGRTAEEVRRLSPASPSIHAEDERHQDMTCAERQLRKAIIAKCRWMNASGLNQGTSGNISARCGHRMLITPSAVPYDTIKPEMIAAMAIEGSYGEWTGPLEPSTEWRFHLDIMRARPDVGSVVHAHSTYATALAIARKPIPACHYMVAAFGGTDIRCAGYARYGTKELSELALAALEDRNGCLLANHGMIALGADLDKAMWRAVELETIARQYYLSLALGTPAILTHDEIAETAAGFETYGLQTPQPEQRRAASRRTEKKKVSNKKKKVSTKR